MAARISGGQKVMQDWLGCGSIRPPEGIIGDSRMLGMVR
jgi:hypothetical protein